MAVGKYNIIAGSVIVLAIIAVVLTSIYFPQDTGLRFMVILGLILGAIISYHFFFSFSLEDTPLHLGPNEKTVIETTGNNIYINVPKYVGGFDGEGSPLRVNLYLTNKRIVAEPLDFEEFLEEESLFAYQIELPDIVRFMQEKRGKVDYIRVVFGGPSSEESEVLLFTGDDTVKWIQELQRLL